MFIQTNKETRMNQITKKWTSSTLGATTEAALTTKERNWLCLRVPGFKVPNLALEALSEAKLLADTVTGDAVSCVAAISAISQNTWNSHLVRNDR